MHKTGFEVHQFIDKQPAGGFIYFSRRIKTHLDLSVEPGETKASSQVTENLVQDVQVRQRTHHQ